MVKNIIHNPVFRIFTPIFYGVTMYILILLIFDRVGELSENFILVEAVLCLTITYLLFESMRLYIKLVEKKCPENCSISFRIILQGGGSIVFAFLITSLIINFYFSKLVGFNTYRTELIVFNTIFILTSVLYNMIYFSFFYLNRINVTQLEQENILRKNAEIELDTYKNKINPDFLYNSLETLISLTKQNTEVADQFILKLSDVYRKILSTKNSELATLNEEIEICKTLIEVFNYQFNNNLKFKIDKKNESSNYQIVSGTLVVIIEDIVNRSIISGIRPLEILAEMDNSTLKIYHPVQNKLIQSFTKEIELKQLKNAYMNYSKTGIQIEDDNNVKTYYIPLFVVEK